MGDVLADLRDKIDSVDSSIIDLLEERFKLTEQVGLYKLNSKDAIVQNGRWQELLTKLKDQAESQQVSPEMVETIWNEIHKESVAQQEKIQEGALVH